MFLPCINKVSLLKKKQQQHDIKYKENSEKSKWLAHKNSLTASRCHIKAYQDAANQSPKWVY